MGKIKPKFGFIKAKLVTGCRLQVAGSFEQ